MDTLVQQSTVNLMTDCSYAKIFPVFHVYTCSCTLLRALWDKADFRHESISIPSYPPPTDTPSLRLYSTELTFDKRVEGASIQAEFWREQIWLQMKVHNKGFQLHFSKTLDETYGLRNKAFILFKIIMFVLALAFLISSSQKFLPPTESPEVLFTKFRCIVPF